MPKPNEQEQLFLQAGEQTEELINFITRGLDDALVDTVTVNRVRPDNSVASEPITIAAIISLSATVTYAVARLLEKWLEIQREKSVRGDVIVAWASDPKLAKELLDMEKKHSDVVVKQGMPDIRMISKRLKTG